MEKEEILHIDAQHIWHPYTQHKTARKPIVLCRAQGVYLYDTAGHRYIDAISSWWANPYGHAHPKIAAALSDQVQSMDHVLFADVAHKPASFLAKRLLPHLPEGQSRLFFSDNGSTAVESALKMCWQYFYNRGKENSVVVAFEGGFHGDTFAAMSVSGQSLFTEAFSHLLPKVYRIPLPSESNLDVVMGKIEEVLSREKVCAFIYEPLVLGASGMKMYAVVHLDQILERFRSSGVLTIADEVMTGFGKTGRFFASDYLNHKPDIVCISKALTAGVLPMAITSCTEGIFNSFYSDDLSKAFFHGHTFTANPIGCAVAAAALDILTTSETQRSIQNINRKHRDFVKILEKKDGVKNIRMLGTILAFDMVMGGDLSYYGTLRNRLYEYYIGQKVWLRPLGNTVYIMPPYFVSDSDLDYIYEIILGSFDVL